MNRHSISSTKYNKENTIMVAVRLNRKTDKQVINRINEIKGGGTTISSYIKELILADDLNEKILK